MGCLTLCLLGGFAGRLGVGPALSVPAKKTRALLAYLALRPGRAHTREALAGLLWGGTGDAQARNNLRHALVELRCALAGVRPPGLLVHGGTLALNPASVDVDVGAFERHVADGTPAALESATASVMKLTEECFKQRTAASDGVRVTAQTSVTFRTQPEGGVTSVAFEPPLSPWVQACVNAGMNAIQSEPTRHGFQVSRTVDLER